MGELHCEEGNSGGFERQVQRIAKVSCFHCSCRQLYNETALEENLRGGCRLEPQVDNMLDSHRWWRSESLL